MPKTSKDYSAALTQAGHMSSAIDRMRAALNRWRFDDFGKACSDLMLAKYRYDKEIEELAK